MAAKIRIELNSDGFRQIASSDEMRELLESEARKVADRAGGEAEGFTVKTYKGGFGGGRHIAVVSASTYDAMLAEATEKTLTKAVTR